MDKKEIVDLLSKKINSDLNMFYDQLFILISYSKRQLFRISQSLKEKGIDSTLNYRNKSLAANNRASNTEVDYIVNSKNTIL